MSELIRERRVLKPVQLNVLARDLLESSFSQVWVEGEISNFSRPASGHLYFTLKDDRAQVRCALFKQKAMYLRFQPCDGMQVLVRGRLTLYEARGDYQLVLEHMEEAGEGALQRAFIELKAKLSSEGVFDDARKRPLPAYVHRLAIITSATGAAIRDVISVLSRRFPLLQVDILPVAVQGEGAAKEIRNMLARANASAAYDVILLTRGGGSLEDLWSFNDEALARDIAQSKTIVMSAIGHEIDFSLSDFAADIRAPTPSAAAELLVPDKSELTAHIEQLKNRLHTALRRIQQNKQQHVDQAYLRLRLYDPQTRMAQARERLLQMQQHLAKNFQLLVQTKLARLRVAMARLERQHPQQSLQRHQLRLSTLNQALHSTAARQLQTKIAHLRELGRGLSAVSPLATLSRGYAIIRRQDDGSVVRDSHSVQKGEQLVAQLLNGKLNLEVKS
ncbi:MAG: exodeoxyribonuclease VII large subunit [Arenimonas sp.]